MALKLIIFSCAVAVGSALLVPAPQVSYAAPIAKLVAPAEDYDHHPRYSYAYDVQDTLTGDFKNHQETRDGDVVQGSYSVLDPDGIKRTVEYTSDSQNGFNAVVHREPIAGVAKVSTPVALPAAPAFATAPVYAAAPAYAPAQAYSAAPAPAYSVAPAYAPAPAYAAAPAYAPAVAYAAGSAYAAPPAYAAGPAYAAAPAYATAPAYAATPIIHAAPIAKLTAPIGYSAPLYRH